MPRFRAILALGAVLILAQPAAAKNKTPAAFPQCDLLGKYAALAMTARVIGEPLSGAMDQASELFEVEDNARIFQALVIRAYSKQLDGRQIAQQAIDDFRDEAYLWCAKGQLAEQVGM